MTILDIFPRYLNHNLNRLVMHWLPNDWWAKEPKTGKLVWAMIFAHGGFVEVDGVLNQHLGEKPCWGNGLGTFAKIDGRLMFVWIDNDGRHTYEFPPYSCWESRSLKAVFKSCLGSYPDFTKDVWENRAMELANTLENLKKGAVFGEALGLFGGAVTLR